MWIHMAWQRVGLVLVLTGILLLVSVRGWERINASEFKLYERDQWSEPSSITADDDDDDDSHYFYKYLEGIFEEAKSVATKKSSPKVANLETEDKTSPEEAVEEAEDDDYDDYTDEEIPEEIEGLATSEVVDFMIDPLHKDKPDVKSSEFHVEFIDVPLKNWTGCIISNSKEIDVVCSEGGFQITLPQGRLSQLQVVGFTNISVEGAPGYCGYHLDHLKNVLTVDFRGCNVREDVEDIYSLQVSVSISGQARDFTAFCIESTKFDVGQFPRNFDKLAKCNKPAVIRPAVTTKPSKCAHKTPASPAAIATPRTWFHSAAVPPMTANDTRTKWNLGGRAFSPKPHNCAVDVGERVPCGHLGVSPSDCEKRGCCWDFIKYNCYYQLDVCTADQHFVFAIRHNCALVPLDPRTLLIPGHPVCKPAIVNDEVAIFKVKLGDCGSHSYDVGDVTIYLIEVHTVVKALNLKYGIITRSDPLRFLIECRYSKHGRTVAGRSLASVGYMVKTSTSNLPSSVFSSGLYDVELKIAKDRTYTKYFSKYHQPLQLLLGQPVYLELNLRSPESDSVLLVNYCLAYPRSAKNALVLIHEGCANPNDPAVSILHVSDLPRNRHQRRFVVEAFQFMIQKTNMYLNEEIYFMCSSEVCMPSEKLCEERCFDGRATL